MDPRVIDALVSGEIRLMDAWVAHQRGTLEELLSGIGDPLVSEAVEAFRPHASDGRVESGLDQIVKFAPATARLSWLQSANVSGLYSEALKTRKPNSVQRSLHRAVRELLTFHVGLEAVRIRMEGVRVPRERDTRDVRLTPAEIRTLLDSTPNDRFRWMVALAMLTTADRGPLLRLTTKHYRNGSLEIVDTKAADRHRIVRLSAPAETILRLSCQGLEAGEKLFPWTIWQVRKLWDGTRDAAKLPGLRFKDLRHLLPGALAEIGVDRKEIQAILGHAPGSRMTDRYIAPAGNVARLDEAAALLGLKDAHLRKEA
jgi:integrase